jgi:DNA-binding CsgD family transcriptional regulator
VLLDLAKWERFADDWAAPAAALCEAAELVPTDPPSALRARVLTDLAHDADLNGRWDEARRLAEEAIEVSRAIGAPEEEARALVRLAEVLLSTLRPVDADRLLTEAKRILVDMDTAPEDLMGILVFRQADTALLAGDFGRAIAIADAGLARAARAGTFGGNAGFLRAIKITALADLGRWHEAETLAEEARRRDPAAVTARMAVESFVPVLVRQGKVAEATAAVRATDPGTVTTPIGVFTLEARIRVAYGEGRWDDARAAADEMVGLLDGPDLSLLDLCVGGEADRAEFARGRRRTAEEAEARRVGLARLVLGQAAVQEAIDQGGAGPAIEAILAMAEAEGSRLVDRPDVKRWEDVARRREALAQPWETAYARFRQAEAILATGGPKDQALLVLRGAHDIASQLRASPLLDQIERLARRSRMRLTPAEAGGRQPLARTPEGVSVVLTAREREVLTLVAAGHTNREIGRDLFISEKTASVHVSNAMDKLGALSRYDAAASATRLGLLDAASRGSVTR